MTVSCLQCHRTFPDPDQMKGNVEPGGVCLCLQCGHAHTWTDELTLREMTDEEYGAILSDWAVLRAVQNAGPRRAITYRGSSVLACMVCLILVMIVLERFHITAPQGLGHAHRRSCNASRVDYTVDSHRTFVTGCRELPKTTPWL
jgi:hypothetical protein